MKFLQSPLSLTLLSFYSFFPFIQVMSKKYLTPEDRAELDHLTRTSGVKGAAVGLAIGLGAAALTYRRSPHFRALTMPMQAILPASGKKS